MQKLTSALSLLTTACLLAASPAAASFEQSPILSTAGFPPAEGRIRPEICPPRPEIYFPSPEAPSTESYEIVPPSVPAEDKSALQAEKLLHLISSLPEDQTLSEEHSQTLSRRLAADPSLGALLEQRNLSGIELACLALPNGRIDSLERYRLWSAKYPDLDPNTVVLQVNMDLDRPAYDSPSIIAEPDSLTALVNKQNALPFSYIPELETLGAGYGSGSLRPEAARAFRAMADGARAEGISLRSVSSYRSFGSQKTTYNRYLKQYKQKVVDTFSARPGSSEHQTGLALDINTASSKAHFEKTPAFAWLKEHCAEYGFILRYPEGQDAVTGYRFEPWHYRYVGTEIASACMGQGLTYEAYLALLPAWTAPAEQDPQATL